MTTFIKIFNLLKWFVILLLVIFIGTFCFHFIANNEVHYIIEKEPRTTDQRLIDAYYTTRDTLNVRSYLFKFKTARFYRKQKIESEQKNLDLIEVAKQGNEKVFQVLLEDFTTNFRYYPTARGNVPRAHPNTSKNWQAFHALLLERDQAGTVDPIRLFMFYQSEGTKYFGFNPHYNPDKAKDYLIKAAKNGTGAAQLLLAALYETGSAMQMNTPKDPIQGLAWRVNSMFNGNERITHNHKQYERNSYISEQCSYLQITNCAAVAQMVATYADQYPVIIPISTSEYSPTITRIALNDILEGVKRNSVYDLNKYADLLQHSFQFYNESSVTGIEENNYYDHETAEKYYQRAYTIGSANAAKKLASLYSKKGSLTYGFNATYNASKALVYDEIARDRGNHQARMDLYKIYGSGFSDDTQTVTALITKLKSQLDDYNYRCNENNVIVSQNYIEDMIKRYGFNETQRAEIFAQIKAHTDGFDPAYITAWDLIDRFTIDKINNKELIDQQLEKNMPSFCWGGRRSERKLTKEEAIKVKQLIDDYRINTLGESKAL